MISHKGRKGHDGKKDFDSAVFVSVVAVVR